MLDRLAAGVVARRRRILIAALVAVIVTVAVSGDLATRLTGGGFVAAGAESEQARVLLSERFGLGQPDYVLLVTAPAGRTVDDPAVTAAATRLASTLAADRDVVALNSYWAPGKPPTLRSEDGRSALLTLRLAGDDDHKRLVAGRLTPRVQALAGDGVTVQAGGLAEVYRQMNTTIERDLKTAEAIAIPVTLFVLLLVFGSVMAAMLPVAVGIGAIVGTMAVLRILSEFTDVSVFAMNLTTALGLGLAIDYSLLIVTRYREELANGAEPAAAIGETVRTAGRTVLYSALTVAAAMSALLVFPLPFLRSFGYAAIAVVLLAAVGAIVVLPAALAVLGRRVDMLRVPRLGRSPKRAGTRWATLASAVMRRPVAVLVGSVVLLLTLGAPFLHAQFGLTDDRALPPSVSSRQVGDTVRTQFGAGQSGPVQIVSRTPVADGPLSAYAQRLSTLPGVERVESRTGAFSDGRPVALAATARTAYARSANAALTVTGAPEAFSSAGAELVRQVRAQPAPVPVLVGGSAARVVDTTEAIQARLPLALLVMALAVGILLFLFTGSVVMPIKAIVLNLLSLTATFGALVFVFQDGHLMNVVGEFTVTGMLDVTVPILMFCVAFGLSMDYEVFILGRIREEYERTGDPIGSVAAGLQRTGRVVTAAAVLMALVFASFAVSGVSTIKLFGAGLALAVIIDATIVRTLLLPAVMRLMGHANWWAPAPLRRLHDRIGLSEAPAQRVPLTPSPAQGVAD